MCDDTTCCPPCVNNPVSFTAIGGVDLRYHNGARYTCIHTTDTTPTATTAFKNRADNWVNRLEAESSLHGGSGYSTLQWIGHIGFATCDTTSCHAAGRAMDMTKLVWNGNVCEPCAKDHTGDRTKKRRYLAVDATLRMYFKWVLDGWFDASHDNHIHASNHFTNLDNVVLDRAASSDTFFVQAVCNNFNGAGLMVDGSWGSKTEAAWDNINNTWGWEPAKCGSPFQSHAAYEKWLHRVVYAGFSDVGASGVPTGLDGC